MSDQNGSRLDVPTVANVVSGVINALGLQPSQSSVQSGSNSISTSITAVTQSRRVNRFVCIYLYIAVLIMYIS